MKYPKGKTPSYVYKSRNIFLLDNKKKSEVYKRIFAEDVADSSCISDF